MSDETKLFKECYAVAAEFHSRVPAILLSHGLVAPHTSFDNSADRRYITTQANYGELTWTLKSLINVNGTEFDYAMTISDPDSINFQTQPHKISGILRHAEVAPNQYKAEHRLKPSLKALKAIHHKYQFYSFVSAELQSKYKLTTQRCHKVDAHHLAEDEYGEYSLSSLLTTLQFPIASATGIIKYHQKTDKLLLELTPSRWPEPAEYTKGNVLKTYIESLDSSKCFAQAKTKLTAEAPTLPLEHDMELS